MHIFFKKTFSHERNTLHIELGKQVDHFMISSLSFCIISVFIWFWKKHNIYMDKNLFSYHVPSHESSMVLVHFQFYFIIHIAPVYFYIVFILTGIHNIPENRCL